MGTFGIIAIAAFRITERNEERRLIREERERRLVAIETKAREQKALVLFELTMTAQERSRLMAIQMETRKRKHLVLIDMELRAMEKMFAHGPLPIPLPMEFSSYGTKLEKDRLEIEKRLM